MNHANLTFTAVFLKVGQGYVGFIEELPQVTAQGATLDRARNTLRELAAVIVDAERQSARELVGAREALREPFVIPLPRPEPKPDPSLTTSSAPRAYAAPNGSR